MKKIDKEKEIAIIKDYCNDIYIAKLSKVHNVSQSCVLNILKRNNIPLKKISKKGINKKFNTDSIIENIVNEYKSNKSLVEISKKFNMPSYIIRNRLKKLGIEIRQSTLTNKKWTKEEVDWLEKNYKTYTYNKCALFLNRTEKSILKKVTHLNLKKIGINNIDIINKFKNISQKEISYFLGLLWADGTVCKTNNNITLTLVEDDFNNIENILKEVGIFTKSVVTKQAKDFIKRQPLVYATLTNKDLHSFLKDLGYCNKSLVSARDVLNIIPDNLKHYWFLGYFDGDGCLYLKSKPKVNRITIAGTYEQDFSFLQNYFKNIRFIERRTVNKNGHKSGVMELIKTDHVKIFLDHIYKNTNIGLTRKREKYNNFLKLTHDI